MKEIMSKVIRSHDESTVGLGKSIRAHDKVIHLIEELDTFDFLPDGWTYLHEAAGAGNIEACKAIIDKNIKTLFMKDDNGTTPLHVAAFKGYFQICKLFISKMTSDFINAVDKDGWAPLHQCASEGHTKIVKLLITHATSKLINNIDNGTILHHAVLSGNKEICEIIISKMQHDNLFIISKRGECALDMAIRKGYKDIEDLIRSKLMYTMSEI